jgi:tetratricopeptide (TPR) repeat protein
MAIAIVPTHPLFLDNLGMVYLQEFSETKNPELLASAKRYFQRAVAASPNALDPRVHMEAVLIRSLNGFPEHDFAVNQEIIQNNTAMLNIDPFIPFARKNLASAYYNVGQVDRAFAELQTAIDYEPNYVPGHLQMADWYRERGDVASSQRYSAIAMSIVNKYRNFKPTEPYEGVLLGRPEQSWARVDEKR